MKKSFENLFWFNLSKSSWAFTFIELILYMAFVGFIWLASFFVINQFFDLNKTLYSYKEYKMSFLNFEKDLINLITNDYSFYTWGNKLVLSWENNLVWFICSWNILKANFDSNWNITYIVKKYKNLPCKSLSWYYQTWINLDLNLKFKWTWLVLHYYFK